MLREVADLRAQLAAKDAEIARLTAALNAAETPGNQGLWNLCDHYEERGKAKDAEIAATRSTALTAAFQACEDRADLYRLAAEQTASAACERDLYEQARGARACAAAIRALMEPPHA